MADFTGQSALGGFTSAAPTASEIAEAILSKLGPNPTAIDIATAIAAEDTYDGPTAADIGSAIEAADTYKGPTALQIAVAIASEDTYDGPAIGDYQAAFLAALVAQNLSATQIGVAVEASDTFKGLTEAQQASAVETALTVKKLSDVEIALAQEAERNNADIRVIRGNNLNTAGTTLVALEPSLAGLTGTIISVADTGGGNIRITLDGSSPQNTNGSTKTINAYNVTFNPVYNVSFDDVQIDPSQANGDVEFIVEVYA